MSLMVALGFQRGDGTRDGRSPRLCIARPGHGAYSETFIQQHVDCLTDCVVVLEGEGYQLLALSAVPRALRWLRKRALAQTAEEVRSAAFRKFLRRHRIDVVLAEYGPLGVALLDPCRDLRIPLVVHFHGYDAHRKDVIAQYQDTYPRLLAEAAAVIVVSASMSRALVQIQPSCQPILIPYGVDTDQFEGAHPAEAPPHFVAVGRFVDKKAPHLTLMAFREVATKHPGARLTMAGDGPLLEACKQLAGSLRLGGSVELFGAMEHKHVRSLLQGARAFVQHSVCTTYGDSEGTPVAILEAAASGLPVVATRHAGIPEAVIDGSTGYLVDERDVDGMGERMLRLAQDAELAARLGAAARLHISTYYSAPVQISRLSAVLRTVSRSAR